MDVRLNGELKKLDLLDQSGNDVAAKYLEDEGIVLRKSTVYKEPIITLDDYTVYADEFAEANKILEAAKDLPEYFHSWAKDVVKAQCDQRFLYSTLAEGLETWEKMSTLRAIHNGERPASDAAKNFAQLVLDAKPVDEEDLTEVVEQEKFDMPRKYNKQEINKAVIDCDVLSEMNESAKQWYMKQCPKDKLGKDLTNMTFKELYMDLMENQHDIRKTMNMNPPDILESIMKELAKRSRMDYGALYEQWQANEKNLKSDIPKEDRKIIQKHGIVCGIDVTVDGLNDVSINEVKNYLALLNQKIAKEDVLTALSIHKGTGDTVGIDYVARTPKIERIRRITGYLVGDMDRWNNAKKAEERDRVKHMQQYSLPGPSHTFAR